MRYNKKLRRFLPRPFRRGEGRGEGLLGVVYPVVLSVNHLRSRKTRLMDAGISSRRWVT
jgi:hypothetical protein